MTLNRAFFIAALAIAVAACSNALSFHAAGVMRFSDGSEWRLSGRTSVDFEFSSLTQIAGPLGSCTLPMERQLDRSGQGSLTCRDANGTVVVSEPYTVPAGLYGTSLRGYSVTWVDTPTGRAQFALGWGAAADPDQLRRYLD